MYCEHTSDDWTETDDGCAFCEECGAAVCSECGALYEASAYGMDTGEPEYSAPCRCSDIEVILHGTLADPPKPLNAAGGCNCEICMGLYYAGGRE